MNFQRVFRRSISAMSNPSSNVSPFTRATINAMKKLYPEELADKSFDNTGLLLEAPYRPNHLRNSALLTIDLTKAVADEAIANKHSIIIAYHPIIFRGLKSFTQANTQQNSLLRLAQEGISVYCPHTAVDAAPRGLNDWLVDIVTGWELARGGETKGTSYKSTAIKPLASPPPGFEDAGYGRIVRFQYPQALQTIIDRISKSLHLTSGLSVATPQSIPIGSRGQIPISSIGLCAGSGGSTLGGLDVDLLFTGELSHHEALAAIEEGKCVITAFHSNTERLFLPTMSVALQYAVQEEIEKMEAEDAWPLDAEMFTVSISKVDRDPFEIIRADQDQW